MPPAPLPFETEIHDYEQSLARLEANSVGLPSSSEQIRLMRQQLNHLKREKYDHLDAWETVQVARHPQRPQLMDYVDLIFENYVEMHGDRAFGDDRAIRTGFARLGDHRIMLIGHQKGHTLPERLACFYGCAHPEGYRKSIIKMKMAAKFGLPVVCLIDTPGAFPGIGSEERGVAQLIADSLLEMSRLPTPIICVVIGEGGSGGALGIGIGDRVAMLRHAYYSVISPEGCAGILWKTANDDTKSKAAEALRMTSPHLLKLGVIDDVIPEPLGGAHRDQREMASSLKSYLVRTLRELRQLPTTVLLDGRYQKFRKMGVYLEERTAGQGGEPGPNGAPHS